MDPRLQKPKKARWRARISMPLQKKKKKNFGERWANRNEAGTESKSTRVRRVAPTVEWNWPQKKLSLNFNILQFPCGERFCRTLFIHWMSQNNITMFYT